MGILNKILEVVSGNNTLQVSDQLLFDKVIGFRGIVPGCGTSTFVQNLAVALSMKTKYNICVLDTNFMFPIQYQLLIGDGKESTKRTDILDFSGDVSLLTIPTQYSKVYLADLSNRNIVDMLSGKDSADVIGKVINALKSYFDIILIDIAPEYTNIMTAAAIKCNRIYQVADTSLKCMSNIKKSLNTMATLGVPLAKANTVIINKQLPNVLLGLTGALIDAGLSVEGEVPLSEEIAVLCASGKPIYAMATRNTAVSVFNAVIDSMVSELIESDKYKQEYNNIQEELEKYKKNHQNMEEEVDTDTIFDSMDDDDGDDMLENVNASKATEGSNKGGNAKC